MSSLSQGSNSNVGKGSPFPTNFFDALNTGNEAKAMEYLHAEAFTDGVPSPRTQKLIEAGKWDGHQKVSLALVESNACAGRVGQDSREIRFCGKPPGLCISQSHSKTTVGNIQRGWYINMGKVQGLIASPCLPPLEEGGPIKGLLAGRLMTSGDHGFKLTKGMWEFIIDAWHALRVESVSSGDSEEEVLFVPESEAVQDEPKKLRIEVPAVTQWTAAVPATHRTLTDELRDMSISDQRKAPPKTSLPNEPEEDDLRAALRNAVERYTAMADQALRQEQRMLALEEQLRESNRARVEREQEVERAMARMHTKMIWMEDALETAQQQSTSQSQGQDTQQTLDRIEVIHNAIFSEHGELNRFKTSFNEFKERLESGGGIECNGISFRSYQDFMNWYDRDGATTSLFLDGLAYMHAVKAPVVHADDATKQRELQEKVAMTSSLEAAILTSFDTILPSVLVGGGGKKGDGLMGGTFDWLSGYLKTFKVWKPTGTTTGVSHQITQGVTSVSRRVAELRRRYVSSEVLLLSAGLCQDSALFLQELVRFVNEQQEELTEGSVYTEDQIWSMQLECIQKIVEELHEAREPFSEGGRTHRGNYVWGMLMAWKIQQRYLDNHFKDDPVLNGLLVRRVLLQGQDNSVKKQLAKVETTAAQLEELKRKHASEIAQVKAEITKLKAEAAKK